jgi:hypothetical protein
MNQTLDLTDALEQIKAGEFELDIPRDRNSLVEPQIVKKHQTHISEQIDWNWSLTISQLVILFESRLDESLN